MEKTRLFSALAAVSLAALILFACVCPVGAKPAARTRTGFSPSAGSNKIFQLGEASKRDVPAPEVFMPSSKDDSNVSARPEGFLNDAPVDFSGDGRTDFVVVRNTGGGPSGQLTWYYSQNGGSNTFAVNWGLNSDWILTQDFDGDLKDDITIWRPGPGGTAAFYIFQSATSTLRVDQFGQTGDAPSVSEDYDGDGKADPAVFRNGSPAIWYYRGSFLNPAGNITAIAWGTSGDIPAPGDFDADGRADFGIARNSGTGQLDFWRMLSTGSVMNVVRFGTTADLYVPGDYDGDGKTDIATVRSNNGQLEWQYFSSLNGSTNSIVWGGGNDFPTQGDYDGDGKTDFAIWRRGVNPGEGTYWALLSSSGSLMVVQWGSNGDFPAASFNVF
jgi:hypothetical protein